jgi:hypothetical protein
VVDDLSTNCSRASVRTSLHDPTEIATAIARVITDAKLRATLGAHEHRQAPERFSMQRFVDGHVAALEAAAGRRSDD